MLYVDLSYTTFQIEAAQEYIRRTFDCTGIELSYLVKDLAQVGA
jgi:hypothetical protein